MQRKTHWKSPRGDLELHSTQTLALVYAHKPPSSAVYAAPQDSQVRGRINILASFSAADGSMTSLSVPLLGDETFWRIILGDLAATWSIEKQGQKQAIIFEHERITDLPAALELLPSWVSQGTLTQYTLTLDLVFSGSPDIILEEHSRFVESATRKTILSAIKFFRYYYPDVACYRGNSLLQHCAPLSQSIASSVAAAVQHRPYSSFSHALRSLIKCTEEDDFFQKLESELSIRLMKSAGAIPQRNPALAVTAKATPVQQREEFFEPIAALESDEFPSSPEDIILVSSQESFHEIQSQGE